MITLIYLLIEVYVALTEPKVQGTSYASDGPRHFYDDDARVNEWHTDYYQEMV